MTTTHLQAPDAPSAWPSAPADLPAAAAAADLARWLGAADTPTSRTGRLHELATEASRRDRQGHRLATLLVAAAPSEAGLLARSWRVTGLERLVPDDAADLLDAGHRERLARLVPDLPCEPDRMAGALRERGARLLAAHAAGKLLQERDRAFLAAVVALDAALWRRRADAAATRDAERPGAAGRAACWRLEADDRCVLADALVERAPAAAGTPPTSRLRWTLGPDAVAALRAAASQDAELARLGRLLHALDREALSVPDPARGLELLLALAREPGPVPLVAAAPDPLLMATFVLERGAGGEASLPLPPGRAREARDADAALPEGVRLTETAVVVDCGRQAAGDGGEVVAADPRAEQGGAALKALVLANLQSTSATLAFLRDARVSAVPGLVAEVVARTRNPQILETVASDRALHAGFANRAVPAALLRSPVNVSVRTLRRFIHVKYVSKLELKRMAVDSAGIRKEVIREIEKYLATLA